MNSNAITIRLDTPADLTCHCTQFRSPKIDTDATQPRLRIVRHLVPPAVVAAIALGGCYLTLGITIVEKSLSAVALPVGFIWLALIMSVYFSIILKQRVAAVIAGVCLCLVWVFGNFFVANSLSKSLERPYLEFDLNTLPHQDVVVVLGGGTSTSLNGSPQLTGSGDRVAMAARVFNAGKTDRIICTGSQTYRYSPDDLPYGDEAKMILGTMGVPQSAVETIVGDNTFQEMQNLKIWLTDQPEVQQVGILTSAWHLNRAMRLASKAGITATPIPADFRSSFATFSADWVIPSAANLNQSSLALKEYLAAIVGR